MNKREQLRKAQIYIANEVKRICNNHKINYFLDCGSMLGAVRHHGFIPWDDDMDIGMIRDDYIRFLKVASTDLRPDFFIDNYSTNEDNALVFSKIRLRGTKYIETKGNPNALHNEIFVDIFPYYYISDNDFIRKIEGGLMAILSQSIMSKSGYKVWLGDNVLKRLKFLPTDIIGKLLSKKRMHYFIDLLFWKHDETARLCIHSGSCYDYWFFPKKVLTELIEVDFEGELFMIPKHYEEYLSTVYGDFMTPPPQDRQINHLIQHLDLGNYKF